MDHAARDKAHHDAIAQEYEKVVNLPRKLANDALFSSVVSRLPSHRGKMLDLGCGTGQMCDRFADFFEHTTGVDHSEAMLGVARSKPSASKVSFLKGDALTYLDNQSECFDLITAVGFLHHLKQADSKLLLTKIQQHLRPGGVVVIADPMDFDPNDEPGILSWWNKPFRQSFGGYQTEAEDPDEAPIPEVTLRSWFANAQLPVLYSRRAWEIFPRYGGWRDRLAITILDRFCRRRGVVGLFIASV